jgi:(S)-2-hydroxyglutarate dehydrogenase
MIYDIGMVGGGIVGLATAGELLQRHPHLRLANIEEKEATHAIHQSGQQQRCHPLGHLVQTGFLKGETLYRGTQTRLDLLRRQRHRLWPSR